MRNMSKTTCFSTTFILLVAAALQAEGRALRMNASVLVSDGVHNYVQPENSYLYLKGSDDDSEKKYCEQMYGFLPCSSNILGHLFLILVYEYLLFHGESYLAAGGEQVFKILGPGIFGASVFDILGALPESLILLVIGLSGDKESAQDYASTGVGLLSGSSILLLTVVWGTCVIVGNQKLENDPSDSNTSDPSSGKIKELFTGFVSSGITIDPQTRKMANIMICSVMPLFIMQIPTLFRLSYTPRAVTLIIALIVAVVFLISYFIYQVFEPQIEKARLDYIKHHDTILRFFQLVEKQTLQRILNEDGTPNESAIEGLYNEIIRKEGKDIKTSDIKEMLLQNTVTEITENQIAEMLKIFDQNGDQIISRDEFVEGLKKYINEAKHAVDRKYLRTESLKNMYEGFIKPWIEHTRKEREFRNHVTSEVLKHVQSDMFHLSNDDGTPNESAIKRLFEKLDTDRNNKISKSELKTLVTDIHIVDTEKAVTKLIQDLDINRDNEVSEEEFVGVFTKWITTGSSSQAPHSTTVPRGNHQTWEDVEKVMITKQSKGIYAWLKALGHVVLGITMLSLLAEPLIASVQEFSEKAGISSFFISFILVPLATNFREATSAIREASHKKKGIISQTIYEIYGAVFMNNVLGFVVISILIYMRDITWQFSADVLAVAFVCTVMGLTAMFRSTFPLWTSLPAYLLYIFSLVLVLVLKDVLNYV